MIRQDKIKKAIDTYISKRPLRFIPEKKLKKSQIEGAKKHMAEGHDVTHVLGLLDETFFKDGSRGFMITSTAFFFSKNHWTKDEECDFVYKWVHITNLKEVRKEEGTIVSFKTDLGWDYVDCGFYQDDIYSFFRCLLDLSGIKKEDAAAQKSTPKPTPKPAQTIPPEPIQKDASRPAVTSEIAPQRMPAEPKKDLPEVINKSIDMPKVGAVCRMGGEIIFFYDMKSSGKLKRVWNEYKGRALMSGEAVKMLVGWNSDDVPPDYTVTYITPTPRIGAKRQNVYEDEYTRDYYGTYRNVRFDELRSEWKVCRYMGDNTCTDFAANMSYRFDNAKLVSKEIEELQAGDLIVICLFRDWVYYITVLDKYGVGEYGGGIYWYKESKDFFVQVAPSSDVVKASCIFDEGKNGPTARVFEKGKYYRLTRYVSGLGIERLFDKYTAEPVESTTRYGWLYGKEDEYMKRLFFKDYTTGEVFTMSYTEVAKEDYESLCKDPYFASVASFEGLQSVSINLIYATSTADFEYMYALEDGKALLMDSETFEPIEIPKEKLPFGAKEGGMIKGRTSFCWEFSAQSVVLFDDLLK